MSTPAKLLQQARQLQIPMLEARMLLECAAGLSHVQQISQADNPISEAGCAKFLDLQERRLAGEPIAYLLGRREFYGLDFEVGPGVLIPRPETELLIEQALARLPQGQARVVDLGTGSGAISVTLKQQRPQLIVSAVDISEAALTIARRNAQRLCGPIRMLQSDWYGALAGEQFEMIVSNPPYIVAGDPHLAQGDLRFEPSNALTDFADGLSHIRQIIELAPQHLVAGGWLLFEHGYEQAQAAQELLRQEGFSGVTSWQDLAGLDRVSGGRI